MTLPTAVAAAFSAHRGALDAVAVLVCRVTPGATSVSALVTSPMEDPCSHTRWSWWVHSTDHSFVHRHQLRTCVPVNVAYMDIHTFLFPALFLCGATGAVTGRASNCMPRFGPSAGRGNFSVRKGCRRALSHPCAWHHSWSHGSCAARQPCRYATPPYDRY